MRMMCANLCTDVGLAMSFCAKIMRKDTRGVRSRSSETLSETVREAVAVAVPEAVRKTPSNVEWTLMPPPICFRQCAARARKSSQQSHRARL